jgi:hypothetical protein
LLPGKKCRYSTGGGVVIAPKASSRECEVNTMNVVWGLAIAAVGVLFIFWGQTRSEFVVYRLLAARSRMLWGDRVHGFYRISGAIIVVVGAIMAITLR